MANTKVSQWFWTYEDLSRLTGLGINAIQQQKSRGELDPSSLRSVAIWLAKSGKPDLVQEIQFTAVTGRKIPKERAGKKKTRTAKKRPNSDR